MKESSDEWILKRRHEDLSLTVRASWSLYIQFYTVFLTVSVVGLGWVLTRPADAAIVPRAKHVLAIVFVIQTLLTAITSGAMALYTLRWHMTRSTSKIAWFNHMLPRGLRAGRPSPRRWLSGPAGLIVRR